MFWYCILVAAFALVAFLSVKEWKRTNRSRLALRLVASLSAVLSIVILSYPDKKEPQQRQSSKVIVLTGGFNTDTLIRLLQTNKSTPHFSTDYSLIQTSPKQKIKWIPDLAGFFSQHAKDSVYILGNGFTNEELSLLKGHSFFYKPTALKPTVSSIHWHKEIKSGAPLTIQGKYDNNSGRDVAIQLLAFGEVCDSLIIKPGIQKEFSLSTVPKHRGRAVYSFLALSGKDTLQNEPVPIEVEYKSPLRILILSSSPDFEKTFLKNRLAQNGYEIIMNTSISKNKNDEQFLNTAKAANTHTSSYLDNVDVLIADDKSLAQLSASASYAIRSAIEDNGLGMIIKLSDEKSASSFYSQKFPLVQLKQDKKPFIPIHSSLNDSDKYKLKIDEPLCLRSQNDIQPLLQDEQANIYAANYMYGQGRIVATTLNNTYTLALTGNNKAWQSLWALLLDKAAKKTIADKTGYAGMGFSFTDHPTPIVLETNKVAALQRLNANEQISMLQHPTLSYLWQGSYWPRKSGWQTLIQGDGDTKNWFVYDPKNWKDLRDYTKINAMKQYVKEHPVSFLPQTEGENDKPTSDVKLYLVILFFICCGFLWIEQKLS